MSLTTARGPLEHTLDHRGLKAWIENDPYEVFDTFADLGVRRRCLQAISRLPSLDSDWFETRLVEIVVEAGNDLGRGMLRQYVTGCPLREAERRIRFLRKLPQLSIEATRGDTARKAKLRGYSLVPIPESTALSAALDIICVYYLHLQHEAVVEVAMGDGLNLLRDQYRQSEWLCFRKLVEFIITRKRLELLESIKKIREEMFKGSIMPEKKAPTFTASVNLAWLDAVLLGN